LATIKTTMLYVQFSKEKLEFQIEVDVAKDMDIVPRWNNSMQTCEALV
jgi:hypothetical protein